MIAPSPTLPPSRPNSPAEYTRTILTGQPTTERKRSRSTMPPRTTSSSPAFAGPRSTSPPAMSSRSCFPSAWTSSPPAEPFQIYRALRTVNPSPYMFYLKLDDMQVVGASPEMLVRVSGRKLEYRPIAGTHKRGATPAEDEQLIARLRTDEKERAEHVMLVDLGRNDLGRVSEYGSVKVRDLMYVEKYSHVMHLVSALEGELRGDLDALDALAACFPAGTLSGAPKVRAMQIIEELEPVRRAVYGGSVLYADFAGNLDSCIAIRTLLMKGKKAYLQAGAGIVADSDPQREFEETENKSRAVLRAVEMARSGSRKT